MYGINGFNIVLVVLLLQMVRRSMLISYDQSDRDDDFYSEYFRERPGEFNDRCKSVTDCRKFGYVCRGNRTCQCDFMYTPNSDRTSCVGGVNQKCVYDEHCIEGAFCMNQAVCKCKETSPVVLEEGLVCSNAIKIQSSLPLYAQMMILTTIVLRSCQRSLVESW